LITECCENSANKRDVLEFNGDTRGLCEGPDNG